MPPSLSASDTPAPPGSSSVTEPSEAAPVSNVGALLAALNDEQRAAASQLTGPVRILAGAGTGKTRTITHRIAHQIVSGAVRADQILAVTFTDRAAAELRRRLADLGVAGLVRAATFHSAAWAQLRYFWPQISESPLPEVVPSKVGLLLNAARRTRTEARDLAAEIEWAKARLLDPDDYRKARRAGPLPAAQMSAVYLEYEERKREAGGIDYEDMLWWVTRAMADHETVAAEVRDRYRSFTVDEFQDLNPAQWALLASWVGDRDDVCVVGDDHQAIYGFTGATAQYLRDFHRAYPGTRTFPLRINYRSTPQILAAGNAILGKNLRPARRLVGVNASGPKPRVREFPTGEAELASLVSAIGDLIDSGTPPSQIAVCYRINRQSEPFERALAEAGIPFAVRGEGGFFKRREIRQALRVLQDAASRDAPPPIPGPAGPIAERPEKTVTRVLRERLGWHPRRPPAGDAARERWEYLQLLYDLLLAELSEGLSLAEAVEVLRSRAAADNGDGREVDAVSLLTMHRAKGLEFDAVFLVALEDGLVPISYAVRPEEIAEERRLLHVGITRARRVLWLSWAKERTTPTGKRSRRRASRFLTELAGVA